MKKSILFNDRIAMAEASKNARVMRDGYYQYLASEVGLDRPAGTLIVAYRPPSEIEKAHKRFMELERIPVIHNHPDKFVDLESEKSYKDGEALNPIIKDEGNFKVIDCTLKLRDKCLTEYDKGVKELSCGWYGKFEEIVDESVPYDVIQRFEDINHIALLDKGRCGIMCSIKDGKIQGETQMNELEKAKASLKDSEEKNITLQSKVDQTNKRCDELEKKVGEFEKEKKDALAKEAKKGKDEDKEKEDEDLEEEVKDAMIDLKTKVEDGFESVKKIIFSQVLPFSDIDGASPCEIKSAFIKKTTGKDIGCEDMAMLDAHFSVAQGQHIDPSWKINDGMSVKDSETKLFEDGIDEANGVKKEDN